MPSSDIELRFTGDTSDLETSIERAIALAERFREVWGEMPRPDGIERIAYEAGDIVVLRCGHELDSAELLQVKASGEAVFPGATVAVLGGGLRVEAVLGATN